MNGKSRSDSLILDDADRLMSIEETASRLGTSRKVVTKLIQGGHLAALHFHRETRVPKTFLGRFIEECAGKDVLDLAGS